MDKFRYRFTVDRREGTVNLYQVTVHDDDCAKASTINEVLLSQSDANFIAECLNEAVRFANNEQRKDSIGL